MPGRISSLTLLNTTIDVTAIARQIAEFALAAGRPASHQEDPGRRDVQTA